VDDTNLESLLHSRIKVDGDGPKPKYILAAAEKAAERKAIAGVLKAKRQERELARLEREEGPFLRFDTNTGITETVDPIPTSKKTSESEESLVDEDIDLEGMRSRYLDRLAAKDILKLKVTATQMKLIVNWADLARETLP
jgi:hypothetical protein